jgi:hypothetical protein
MIAKPVQGAGHRRLFGQPSFPATRGPSTLTSAEALCLPSDVGNGQESFQEA